MERVAGWVVTFTLMLGAAGAPAARAQAAEPAQALAPAQTVAALPESTVGAVLRNLASRSGVVFVGQVVRIERNPGTVEVVFQVQQPVLGAVGATYTLREWSGLWAGGQQRYRLGERAMVFLHTPKGGQTSGSANGGGLSSPVDGTDGVVPVVVQGANSAALLDVRWLAARVLRARGAPIADADDGAITLAEGAAVAAGWNSAALPEPVRRPLPVGVRPAPPQPVMSAGSAGSSGPMGSLGIPGTSPVVGIEGNRPLSTVGVARAGGFHNMVRPVAAGGQDAVR